VSPGFDPTHILTLHVSASWGETADMKGVIRRIDRTLDALRSVPGVEDAATAAGLPGVPGSHPVELQLLEQVDDRKIITENRFVSAHYFSTMRIPLLSGEPCNTDESEIGIVVNRSFVNAFLNGASVIGRHLQVAGNSFMKAGVVRGVVADARELGMNREPVPAVYWCTNSPMPDPNFLVRTHGDPAAMANALRRKIREVSPSRSVFDVQTLEASLDDAFGENRLSTVLLAFFALTAVSLACIGLYGTLSYLVQVRRREVGLRLALGALRGQIVARFLAQGLAVSAAGCIAGIMLSGLTGKLLAGMLYGVSESDPLTMAGVIAAVLIVASLAALIPAIRAGRLDPMRVLREE
jgi:putative ABC transport system permease protein